MPERSLSPAAGLSTTRVLVDAASGASRLDVGLAIQNAVRRDGQGRVMVELASELVRRGHDVTVYAHSVDDELAGRVRAHRIPPAPGPQIVDDVWTMLAVSRAMRAAGHDVACVLGHTGLAPCPTVFNAQFSHRGWRASWSPLGRPAWRQRLHVRAAARLERFNVARADHVIASTPMLADEVAGDLDVPTTVVPDGVELGEFSPVGAGERAAARDHLGLASGDFVVGFLGDYHTPRKGLEPLLRALAGGPDDERLVVAARGDDTGLDRRVRELGVGHRVVVAGFVPPRTVMAASDAVAVPSLYEPFSLVSLEAAACRVPVVVSSRAGAAGLLGEGAFVVGDPEDPDEIRDVLDRVRSDGRRRRAAVEAGHRAVQSLTWERSAREGADVLERVAAAAGRGRMEDRVRPRKVTGTGRGAASRGR